MLSSNATSHPTNVTADHDRTVHARWLNGSELVRYERAAKWYLEHPHYARELVTAPEAVEAMLGADVVYLDRPGGKQVSRHYRNRSDTS